MKVLLARITFAILLGFLVAVAFKKSYFEKSELTFYDWRLEKSITSEQKAAPLVIVGITENFELKTGKPFSRKSHVRLLDILEKENASVIGFDMFFPDITDKESDGRFISSIKKSGKVVLPVFSPVQPEDRQGIFYIAPKVRSSAAEFNAAAASIGHINVLRDKDQIVRRIPAFIQYGKRKYPQISLEIARLYNKRDDISFSYPRTLRFSAKNIPINRDGSIYIRMLSQKEITKYFIPFEDVLAGKYKKDRFKNKVIIIGQTIVGAKNADLIPTPAGTQFGVLLQASCIHNVITGEHIYRMGENSIIVLLFIWAVLMGSTIFTSLTALNTFLLLFFGGAIAYFSLYSMRNSGLFFDAVPFFVLSFSCYFSSVIYSLFTAVKKLLQKESAINVLKDVEKEITNILSPAEFSDDAGEETFTSFEGEALIKQTPEITLKTILSSVGIQYGALIIGSASRKYQVIAEEGDLTSKAEVEKIINKSLEQKKPVIMNKIPLSSGLKKYDIKNMMLIPVIFHPTIKVFGIFFNKQYAPFSKHAHFSKDDLPIISSLTLQSLIAIQNAKLNITLKDTQLESIFRLSVAIEYRDRETGMHIHRVSEYAGIIGENIGFRENEIELIKNAMPLHDIGKIAIPDKVLLKPGRLTDEEREIVKEHPVLGAKILEGSKSITLKVSEIIALYHHEKYDGTGYPFGLKGNSIPLYGRIAAIADIFDALSSKRVYKEAMGFEESKSLLLQESGTTFDPRLVKSFLKSEEKIKMIMETYREKEDGTSMGAKHE